jgi:hypothetical protein
VQHYTRQGSRVHPEAPSGFRGEVLRGPEGKPPDVAEFQRFDRPYNMYARKSFLARWDDCPESYCHDPGVDVGVSVTPQGENFNLGYIF